MNTRPSPPFKLAGVLRKFAASPTPRGEFPRRLFCQELSVLLDAGIPLYESLTTLREKEVSQHVVQVLSTLTTALQQGKTLSQAMRMQPQAFSALLIASIEASQRTGQTSQALRQHGAYLAWLSGLRDKLVSAAIYPAILIGASLLVITFLTVFVVPRFADIYEGMGGELPWLSGLLLTTGKAVGEHPWPVLMGLVGVGMGIVAAWRSPRVRAWGSTRLWRAPVIGPRMRLIELASLYRTLGLLLQAGVAVVPALEASAELVGPSPSVTPGSMLSPIPPGTWVAPTTKAGAWAASTASRHARRSVRAGPAPAIHHRTGPMAPALTALLMSVCMGLGASLPAHAEDNKASREREALRRAQQSLRQTQEERDALAGEKASLAQARDKAESELKQTFAQVKGAQAKAQALRARSEQLEASLKTRDEALAAARQREAELQAQLSKTQAELADKARTLASVTAMLAASTQDRQVLLAQNKALYATGLDMVKLLRTQSPSEWQRATDAMLGLSAVTSENLAEAFRTRLDDANFNAQPATGAGAAR